MELHNQIERLKHWIEGAYFDDDAEYLSPILASLQRLQKLDQAAHKRASKKKETDPEYQRFVELYFDFHLAVAGVKPMMDGRQGKALKEIMQYLGDNVKSENFTAFDAWKWILSHWTQLSPFLQNQVTLSNIKKNLPEILMQLRNGATTQQKTKATTASAKERIIRRRTGTDHTGG